MTEPLAWWQRGWLWLRRFNASDPAWAWERPLRIALARGEIDRLEYDRRCWDRNYHGLSRDCYGPG